MPDHTKLHWQAKAAVGSIIIIIIIIIIVINIIIIISELLFL